LQAEAGTLIEFQVLLDADRIAQHVGPGPRGWTSDPRAREHYDRYSPALLQPSCGPFPIAPERVAAVNAVTFRVTVRQR
jgi:hypothetical protein